MHINPRMHILSVECIIFCAGWILTTPGLAPSQRPSQRPGGGWPRGSWLWLVPALRSREWSPSGSPGLSASSSWTLQHTRVPCISPHTFWPLQTSPWKTWRTWGLRYSNNIRAGRMDSRQWLFSQIKTSSFWIVVLFRYTFVFRNNILESI